MANTWQFTITSTPQASCAPTSANNIEVSFSVTGSGCTGTNYESCSGTVVWENVCSDASIDSFMPQVISYFKSNSTYAPLMTDADTIYVNGALYTGPTPTHYISLKLGFVPPELAAMFQTYISEISSTLFTKIALPPAPWQYVSTTYDPVANEFNLWFYIPATAVLAMTSNARGFEQHANPGGEFKDRYSFMSMSPGALQDLYDWFAAWVALIVSILLIILGLASGGWLGLIVFFSGIVILSWRVYDAVTKQQIAETEATNVNIQLQQVTKATQAAAAAETAWQSSTKTQADCTTRLTTEMNVHISEITGYLNLYAKYSVLVGQLNTELTAFTTKAKAIIAAMQAASYVSTTCDTYYTQLTDLIGTSEDTVNSDLAANIIPTDNYSVACKGWTDQANCEKAGCFWYNASCNQDEQCWISNPLGGCILSAKTGTVVLGSVGAILLSAFAYWLFTRKGEEVKSIYSGAKEAATGEIERAKAAYSGMTTTTQPQGA